MASTFETGHVKNMNNLENLIKICSEFGSAYNPSKSSLQIASLSQLLTDAKAAINTVNQKLITYNNTVHDRQLKFEKLRKIATRIIYALEITDANKMNLENAKSLKKKILGVRIGKVAPPAPPVEGSTEPEKKPNSTAQTSYGQLVDHFSKLIILLQSEPTYNPNENDLKIASLTSFLEELTLANSDALGAEAILRTERIHRNELFYTSNNCLFETVTDAKKYVKSIFGVSSVEYKQLTSIQVRKP
jgi:hypothetical protein